MDKTESKITLTADVDKESVSFSGGFPHLAHTYVTMQTSQSPWEDLTEAPVDGTGAYAGTVNLPPGIYRIRFIHKPSGLVSNVKTIVIDPPRTEE
jgi:hypothetical protein